MFRYVPVLFALVLILHPMNAHGEHEGLEEAVQKAQAELEAELSPEAGLFASRFQDQNEISFGQLGFSAELYPAPELPLQMRILRGRIRQAKGSGRPETEYDRTAALLEFGELFATPAWSIFAKTSFEDFSGDGNTLWGGKARIRHYLEDGTVLGGSLARGSFWMDQDRRNPRLFNRLVDLSRIDRDFSIHQLALFAELVPRPEHQWRIEPGFEALEDGNSRGWFYTHYHLPVLDSRAGRWTVLRPNLYMEFNAKDDPSYFSPDSHITLGTMLHTIREYGIWTLEGEINPQVLITDGQTGIGIHGTADVSVRLGPFRIGAGTFGYADSEEYWIWRITAKASCTF